MGKGMKVTDNYNKEWENITDPVIFYSTWLQKDKDAILSKIESVETLDEKVEIFDRHFKPVVYLKVKPTKWSMYGYDKH